MGVRVSLIYRRINKGEIDFPITPRMTSAIVELFEVIRDHEEGKRIHGLEVTSGQDAQQQIQSIAERLCAEHSLSDFECIQRLGYVPAGEAILCVRTAAAERQQAMTAADQFVNELNASGVVSRELRE